MSFFFTKSKPKPTVSAKPAQAGNASKASMNRLGCRVCPLDRVENHTPKMAPELRADTDIYFLGDAPSKGDDEKGKPFSDKAGKLLRSLVAQGIVCSFDNVIRDYKDTPSSPPWQAMECCRNLITKSIEEAKPRIIIGLGIQPLQWALNSSDMVGLRGRVFAIQVGNHPCWFLPTYHPQYIIETAFNAATPLRSKLGHCLKFDIAKAVSMLPGLAQPVIDTPQSARAAVQAFDGTKPGHLAQVLALISEARRASEKAIDVETSTLRPYAAGSQLLCMALSYNNINFSFALDHPNAGWSKSDLASIDFAVESLLSDETRIIAHNASFEIEWLIARYGKGAIFHDVWECTMMQAHFLDERRGKRGGNDDQFQPNPYQALDFLVKQYFGLSYKGLFRLDRKNMSKADLGETLTYNGADTKYTLRLYSHQKQLLKQAGLLAAYSEARQRQPTVALMQSLGIDVDQAQTKEMQEKLSGEIEAIETKIRGYHEVQKFVADRKTFNIASTQDVLKLLKNYVRSGTSLINADGKESVDKGVLEKLNHPIGKDIEEFRNRSKLKSTYVDAFEYGKGTFIWPDGKIHPSFNTTFAETGRTSSDEPNQQNWPSRNDKWVRKQIIPAPGHVLVAFDYGQLEACTAAMCTHDGVLVKALWDDYDIHMEWSVKAAHRHPASIGGLEFLKDKAVMKAFRSKIKNKLVFPAMFGASNESVAGYLNIPIEPVNKLMDEFWETFHGMYGWQKELMNEYYTTGHVSSLTGRRRHYPLTKNQAINYPIQSVACDLVCTAMVELSIRATGSGLWYLHPIMNIHDDLSFSIPDDPKILEEAIETIYKVMLAPSYDFINVPLSVTCSVGNNWLEMTEIDKFWSHKI